MLIIVYKIDQSFEMLFAITKVLSTRMLEHDIQRIDILADTAILLLILEGVPFLALVYYLLHKKQMFMLEKGIVVKSDRCMRSERRMINGLFLTLAGGSMVLAPKIALSVGIEANLSFELLLASMIVLCAGLAMLIGGGLLKYKSSFFKTSEMRSKDL